MNRFVFAFIFLFSLQSFSTVYGPDQRKDISKLAKRWKQAAAAVAVSLPTFYFEELDKDHFIHSEHDQRPYGETVGLCQGERFYNQKSFGHCTAFLIHPKILVSAGHCFLPTGEVEDSKHSYCENFSFWLGYNDNSTPIANLASKVAKKDLVHCKKVIYATNNEQTEPEDNPVDFAIYELKKPVTHIKPLKIAKQTVRPGTPVTTIGHPHGLPAKQSGIAPVRDVFDTTISANMDTLAGNSGGPAFNYRGDVVGILISGHQHNTYKPKGKSCNRINRCNQNGTRCNKESELENSNLLLKNEIWLPYVERFLSKTGEVLP